MAYLKINLIWIVVQLEAVLRDLKKAVALYYHLYVSQTQYNLKLLFEIQCRLGRLGIRNQIVDDLNLDFNEFGWQLQDESDSKITIESMITILI